MGNYNDDKRYLDPYAASLMVAPRIHNRSSVSFTNLLPDPEQDFNNLRTSDAGRPSVRDRRVVRHSLPEALQRATLYDHCGHWSGCPRQSCWHLYFELRLFEGCGS